jgi:cytoplasmic iron level regulating protein YaaA (DUF328/UPF0246 family)
MLAVISPAKTLDYKRPLPPLAPTRPAFEEDAAQLAASASRLSKKRLGELMHISDSLAALNSDRFRGFEAQPKRPALYAFAGDVYAGFEVHSLGEEAVAFAQDHLRILSGLYGLLRPLDEIRPYRLEMGTRWAPGRARDLYAFWGGRVAEMLARDAEESGGRTVINLASKEYWKAVEGRLPAGLEVIEIDFREEGPSGLRFNTFAAKRARGMMARFLCEHRLADPEDLKGFDSDGYRFDPEGSDAGRWRFSRS